MTIFRFGWKDEHGDDGTIVVEDDGSLALELWDGAGDSTLHYLSVEGADALIAALTAARDEAKRLNEEGGG